MLKTKLLFCQKFLRIQAQQGCKIVNLNYGKNKSLARRISLENSAPLLIWNYIGLVFRFTLWFLGYVYFYFEYFNHHFIANLIEFSQ